MIFSPVSISDGPNSHPKGNSRVEDCPNPFILLKAICITRCETYLIASLEMWVGNGQTETAQAQHLGHTTTRWATCICYIGKKLFMWEIICWAFTMGSDTILVMSLTHTQKVAQKWRIAQTHIYIAQRYLYYPMWDFI